jgi:hypothetical protein
LGTTASLFFIIESRFDLNQRENLRAASARWLWNSFMINKRISTDSSPFSFIQYIFPASKANSASLTSLSEKGWVDVLLLLLLSVLLLMLMLHFHCGRQLTADNLAIRR